MPECGICYENYKKLKTLVACKHQICKSCYPIWIEKVKKMGREPTCPFCRTPIKETKDNYEVDYWLNLEPAEWNVYSYTTNNGTEIIKTYKKHDPQPSWRNNDNVIILKRHRQRKKYQRNTRNNN